MIVSMRTRQRGFSVVELITTVAVAAITLAVGLPWFGTVHASLQQRTSISHWMSALADARTQAIERGRNVVACPSRGETCEASWFWHHGWIVFEDHDRDGQRRADEPLLLYTAPDHAMRIATSVGRDHIRYRPDGSSEGSNATITFCDRRGAAKARTLVISNVGRVRAGSASPAQAAIACG